MKEREIVCPYYKVPVSGTFLIIDFWCKINIIIKNKMLKLKKKGLI